MSTSRKLLVTTAIFPALVVSAFGAARYLRTSRQRSTAEQWLRLLRGDN